MMQTTEQLMEVLLYLFVWGEAGNLRFMPEMLAFLFEVMRAKASNTDLHEFNRSGTPEREHAYLERVVTKHGEQFGTLCILSCTPSRRLGRVLGVADGKMEALRGLCAAASLK